MICRGALFLLLATSTSAFSVSGFPTILRSGHARQGLQLSQGFATARVLGNGVRGLKSQMQQWVPFAAERQQRDPVRLAPLKPLDERIQIRMIRPVTEETMAEGFKGQLQKLNAGDYSDDFEAVVQLMRDDGYSDADIFNMRWIDQGWRSYLVAEDTATGEIIACAQLTRIQVGGYLFLTDDLEVKRLYVKEEYRRLGIANHLVHNLLLRVKPNQRAWCFVDRDTVPFFFYFASGFVGITWSEAGRVFPFVLWVLLWPFHQKRLGNDKLVYVAAEGRGDANAYNPAG